MELSEYQQAIAENPYGKRLPSTLYVFLAGEADLGPTVNRLLQQIASAFKLDEEFNVVNLGYVVNVIEDPAERLEAIVDAYRHAKKQRVVSALTGRPCQPFSSGPV